MSIQASLAKLFRPERAATLERAEEAYAQGRKSDAAAMFRALAEGSGSAPAQLRLAQMYERGEGVLQNFVEAVRWFRGAAEQGSVPAMARLGEIYLVGLAAPDTATPASLTHMTSGAGRNSLLNRMYPQGTAISQDPVDAAQWNARAAAHGDAAALEHPAGQLGLGMLYAGGYGERREHARAQEWLERCTPIASLSTARQRV